MIKIKEIFSLINNIFPYQNQESWDKSGILYLNEKEYDDNILETELVGVLISLDLNMDAINYAIKNNCNLIITHHPLYIDHLFTRNKYFKNIYEKLINNKIFSFSCHTNFDKSKKGMNYLLCKKLKLKGIERLTKESYSFVGETSKKTNINDFIYFVKKCFNLKSVIINDVIDCKKTIKKICICGGAGSSEINLIRKKDKVDVFICSEIKWNYFSEIHNFFLIDIPHYCEYIFVDYLFKFLNNNFESQHILKMPFHFIEQQRKNT